MIPCAVSVGGADVDVLRVLCARLVVNCDGLSEFSLTPEAGAPVGRLAEVLRVEVISCVFPTFSKVTEGFGGFIVGEKPPAAGPVPNLASSEPTTCL